MCVSAFFSSSLSLKQFANSPSIALCFELEYTISFAPKQPLSASSNSTSSASTSAPAASAAVADAPDLTCRVAVAHAVKLLYAPNTVDPTQTGYMLALNGMRWRGEMQGAGVKKRDFFYYFYPISIL